MLLLNLIHEGIVMRLHLFGQIGCDGAVHDVHFLLRGRQKVKEHEQKAGTRARWYRDRIYEAGPRVKQKKQAPPEAPQV
jgi:hypothetical protein